MRLSDKQRMFCEMLGHLLKWIYENDYAVTMGDGYRDPRVFGHLGVSKGYGRKYSNHKIRCAVDLNLFKKDEEGNWVYCTETKDHLPLGEYWESLGGDWGGRFNDGNHYSLEHDGHR